MTEARVVAVKGFAVARTAAAAAAEVAEAEEGADAVVTAGARVPVVAAATAAARGSGEGISLTCATTSGGGEETERMGIEGPGPRVTGAAGVEAETGGRIMLTEAEAGITKRALAPASGLLTGASLVTGACLRGSSGWGPGWCWRTCCTGSGGTRVVAELHDAAACARTFDTTCVRTVDAAGVWEAVGGSFGATEGPD